MPDNLDDGDGVHVQAGGGLGCALIILAAAVFLIALNAKELLLALNGCLDG